MSAAAELCCVDHGGNWSVSAGRDGAFFDYLLEVLKRFYAVDGDAVRVRVKEAFLRAFPEAEHVLPAQTMFYFSNEAPPGKEFALVDMKQAPEWR